MGKYSKYIFTDIESGRAYIKCAVMNSLALCKTEDELNLILSDIPYSILDSCIKELCSSPEWECCRTFFIDGEINPQLKLNGNLLNISYNIENSTLTIKI